MYTCDKALERLLPEIPILLQARLYVHLLQKERTIFFKQNSAKLIRTTYLSYSLQSRGNEGEVTAG